MFDPESVSRAKKICDAHFKALDHETFYLLAREMQSRLFDVTQLQLAKWLSEGKQLASPYAGRRRVKSPADYGVVKT